MYKLVEYKASNIKGYSGEKIMVEQSFVSTMNVINVLAIKHKLILWVTSSFRKKDGIVKGAIVEPAKMGNHFIGHAIDFNLQHTETKEWFNSTKMGDGKGLDQAFLLEVDALPEVRWGGKFNTKDEVHFDSGLNINNPKLYQEIFKALQAA